MTQERSAAAVNGFQDWSGCVRQSRAPGCPNTDPGPLIKLAVYPYLPTTPDHLKIALTSDAAFWIEHYDVLNQRFIAWLSQ